MGVALGCATHVEEEAPPGTVLAAATCVTDPASAVTLYVSTTGKSRANGGTGTCSNPFATLQDAEDEIDARDTDVVDSRGSTQRINSKSYTVYLRGGTYAYQEREGSDGRLVLDQVLWRVASAQHPIRITAYPGEDVVFDGRGIAASAIKLGISRGGCGTAQSPKKPTLIEISRLTFRHYVERGIYLGGGGSKDDTEATLDARCQGGLTIAHNVFERIGDVYNNVCLEAGKNCLAATAMSKADKNRVKCRWYADDGSSELCMGRAGIGGFNSRNNHIHDNVFSHVESADQVVFGQGNGSRITAHAIYVARRSHGNLVERNFVEYSSGDAFKFRDSSSYNQVKNNFVVHSGGKTMILNIGEGSELPGIQNSVSGNVTLFGYPFRDKVKSRSTYDVRSHGSSHTQSQYQWSGSSRFHEGRRAEYELIGGLALGDVDGDGKNELFASMRYPAFGISVIRRSSGTGGGRFLDQLVEVVTGKDIHHLAIGKLESGKPAQLVSNWHSKPNGVNQAELWRGDGRPFGGGKNLNKIYGNDKWTVTALAIGNFDNSGASELLSAFKSDGGTRRVYRGTGTGIGSSIYETDLWDILALTPLQASPLSPQHTLYTAFKRSTGGGGFEARIYAGNGVSSVTNGGSVQTSTIRYFTSLAARAPMLVAHGDPISAKLYATAQYAAETALFAYGPDGSAGSRLERSSIGKFVHVVQGKVGDQPADTVIAHEREFNTLYSTSETDIRATGGQLYHSFRPAPPCVPSQWSCN